MRKKEDFVYRGVTVLSVVILILFGRAMIKSDRFAEERHMEASAVIKDRPKVAITFDDGPSEETDKLLNLLKEKNVKATFFVVGNKISTYPEKIKRMAEEGHTIGNHSYDHKQLDLLEKEKVREEVEKTNRLIEKITGKPVEYLRPPYGKWEKEMDDMVDLVTVFWDVDSLDWKLKNAEKIRKKVLENVKDGDIILMHDGYPSSTEALSLIIDDLKARGYEFVTVEDMIEP